MPARHSFTAAQDTAILWRVAPDRELAARFRRDARHIVDRRHYLTRRQKLRQRRRASMIHGLEKKILRLREDGLSYRKIAERLCISFGAVSGFMYRSRPAPPPPRIVRFDQLMVRERPEILNSSVRW